MKDVDYYSAADKAIQLMDRDNLRAFGRLKMLKHDEIKLIREVQKLYREQAEKARKRYYEIGFEAYLLGLFLAEEYAEKEISNAGKHAMAEEAISPEWVDDILTQTDFVTLYRFDTETERKAQRLAEALSVTEEKDAVIDKALKEWTKQLAQYAVNVTDYAIVQAFEDSGVEGAYWETEKDQKVCGKCHSLDGEWFRLRDIPTKPHVNCRCRLRPGRKPKED